MHWVVDEETKEYYQPPHDEPSGGNRVAESSADFETFELVFGGTAKEVAKFKKKVLAGFKDGGEYTPEILAKYHDFIEHSHE